MPTVKIYGAGSIGNHLAHACRGKGWKVSICDIDVAALERTRKDIYPARYGGWDDQIKLLGPKDHDEGFYDIVLVGTPPDSHVKVALEAIKQHKPRIILLEKPACDLSMEGVDKLLIRARDGGIFVGVGYNHLLTPNTSFAVAKLAGIGDVQTITVRWIEHWGGIYAAHGWLAGPADTYLGYAQLGGGACAEHSHGINIWQYFAQLAGAGRVIEVSAVLDMVDEEEVSYDRIAQLNLKTETGMIGYVVQDVITQPPVKTVRIQGAQGMLEWFANFEAGVDAVGWQLGDDDYQQEHFPKTRPDDFKPEIDYLAELLEDASKFEQSSICLERGLETMLVILAAHESSRTGQTVLVEYAAGFGPQAIQASVAED